MCSAWSFKIPLSEQRGHWVSGILIDPRHEFCGLHAAAAAVGTSRHEDGMPASCQKLQLPVHYYEKSSVWSPPSAFMSTAVIAVLDIMRFNSNVNIIIIYQRTS